MTTTSSTTSSTSSATYGTLSSQGTGTPLQITGLASGLDTNSIISELMAIQSQPLTQMQHQQSGLNALNSQLTSIQSSLQNLALNAQALGSASLFANSQTVSSSDTTRVTATTSSGAGVGGYQVSVTKLANSAQRTFNFTSPTTADTITIDGHQTQVAAGATTADLVNAINADSHATVYAAATSSGTVVLSNRQTGDTGTNFIQLSDTSGSLTETGTARQGQDAQYSVDGVSGASSSNTVTGAIAGVTLSLTGVTTTSGPVTVNVSAPAPSSSAIQSAVQTFVNSYNSVLSQINAQLSTTPSSSDPTVGTLYGDSDLSDLLSSMRVGMYTSGSGLASSMSSMLNIGVSTGAASGSTAPSQSAISGQLTVNATTLANAIQTNPTGVQQMLRSWSQSFSSLVNAVGQPGGSIDSRIQGDSSQLTQLSNRISAMNATLADKQNALTQQYAALESALSSNQSLSSWLTSEINSLTG